MKFRLVQTVVPWTGRSAHAVVDVRNLLLGMINSPATALLPDSITILADLSLSVSHIECFLQCMAAQLARELSIWQSRLEELEDLGLMSASEAWEITRSLKAAQPWFVYLSEPGGLLAGGPPSVPHDTSTLSSGVIPCSGKQHHGVGWWLDRGVCHSGLITSHQEGGDWNWDEDIGHEATHASFGPVPLFSQRWEQSAAKDPIEFPDNAVGPLPENVIARVCNVATEMTVAYVRAEQRFSGSGLPGLSTMEELLRFIDCADRLYPAARFAAARSVVMEEGAPLSVWSGPSVRYLGASALRFAHHSLPLGHTQDPPQESWFRRTANALHAAADSG